MGVRMRIVFKSGREMITNPKAGQGILDLKMQGKTGWINVVDTDGNIIGGCDLSDISHIIPL